MSRSHSRKSRPHPVGHASRPRRRWWLALILGIVLWLLVVAVSHVLPQAAFGLRLQGWTYGIVGILQVLLAPVAVLIGLRPVNLRLGDVGLTTVRWRSDALIGTAVAVTFALLQFLLIIPSTGGAERSDVVVAAAQIGGSPWGVVGFLVLAWTGSFSEELFFRGHFVTTVRNLVGAGRGGLALTTVLTAGFFALLHGYQGWAGMIDTGLYGGVALTLLYLWRRRLTACIVAHAAWNSLAVIGVYLWY